MKKMLLKNTILFLFMITAVVSQAFAEEPLRNTYNQWVNAVATAKGHPQKVLALYAPKAVLIATFSPRPLQNPQKISQYFANFTANKNMHISTDEFISQRYGNVAIASGIYVFSFNNVANKKMNVKARFSFVYHKSHGHWLIVNHHSSQMPSSVH